MRRGSLLWLLVLASCNGAALGDRCDATSDCGARLQCVASVCRPLCERAPDCGDGYACGNDGICKEATGVNGDRCRSEVDCKAGLACELSGLPDETNPSMLGATCRKTDAGHPAGAACVLDTDCRNQTCELGRCIDLCTSTRDCGDGTSCTQIPRIAVGGQMFSGCLQSTGALAWNVPIHGATETAQIAVPATAQSVVVTMRIDDPNQMVGATRLIAPDGTTLFTSAGDYWTQLVRHRSDFAQSVLAMPSNPSDAFAPGVYTIDVRSLRTPYHDDSIGTATPVMTVVAKLDTSVILDLHFYFLDLDEHPCNAAFDGGTLNAAAAVDHSYFQGEFLGELRSVFGHGSIAIGTLTYEDLRDLPSFDGLDLANVGELLKHGAHATGVNVFFVRSISPAGVFAYSPNPGPAGLAGTAQSGIVIALDSLCYRSWSSVADLTAHEIARYMGLYANVEIDPTAIDTTVHPARPVYHRDPIDDDDDPDHESTNLMYYSEPTGTELSVKQRLVLGRSPVLR